ncbi:WXG100-like domain-containing protein [Streptomyces sp. GS7]|uniref:WXG100-like domain-containing protein n=1 Tax=Streptomyces sp. GS7 TaxID=2692234 RepID=UPI0013174D7C|nr:WXG100 family type VII secretion target [Streptomyces sp. GS7]QHC25157.1 hypothetical protein GR130_31120 [Streptomyces sp. GS7]
MDKGTDWATDKLFGGNKGDKGAGGEGGGQGAGGEGGQAPGGQGGGAPAPGGGGYGGPGAVGGEGGGQGYGGPGAAGSEGSGQGYGQPAPGGMPGTTTMPYPAPPGGVPGSNGAGPYPGSPTTGLTPAGDAYGWVKAPNPAPMAPLPEATHPSRGGLGGMLDEAVEFALEKSGMLKVLEKVTGDLAALNAAADSWQAQAKAVQLVAEELRTNGSPLSRQWEGPASNAFGGHMGTIVEALDGTAEEMHQTAKIINSAAQECAQAEGMVIEIISEAIEALIASLAAEAVIAVLTAGIGLIADALIDAAEIAAFVARVAKVSEELATKLEELLKALKELGQAVKAVKNLKTAKNALGGIKKVEKAVDGIREFGKGGESLGKIGKDALGNKSLEGVGGKLGDYALRQGVKKVDSYATGKFEEGLKSGLGIDDQDPVQRSDDLSAKGLGKAAGQSAWSAAKEGLTSDTNKEAVKEELLHDAGLAHDPEPYRVDPAKLNSPFG